MSYSSDVSKVTRTSASEEFPAVILIDNFNGCNLKCSMCDHKNIHKYRPIQLLDLKLYKKIIDEIAVENPDARVWQIYYGDPFLCLDMRVRISYAKEKGLKDVVLNTNGVLMSIEKAKPLIEAGLDAMYVGIDASTEETYGKIRCGGDFKKAVKNTLNYRDLLIKHGNGKQKLFVQFVVSKLNENEIDDFRNSWSKENVNIKIRPKVSWAGLIDAPNLIDNEKIERKACYWLMRTINICADGKVALCSADVHCRVKCGDVTKNTLNEIWNCKLKEYRLMHRESRFSELPEMCRNCKDWQSTYAEFC